jgi:hypothetical protein
MSGFMSRANKRAKNAYQSSVHGKMKWTMLSGGRQGWKMAYQDSNNKTGLAATSMRPGSMPRSLWCKRTTCGPLKKEEGDQFDPCEKCNPVSNIEVTSHGPGGGHSLYPPYGITVTWDLPLCIEQVMTNGTWIEVVDAITGKIVPHTSVHHAPKETQSIVFGTTAPFPFDRDSFYEVKISTRCVIDGHHHTSAHASFLFCFDSNNDSCL